MEKTIKQTLDGMLQRREYSVAEIRLKLLGAGYIPASVNAIISDYVDKGFISNERYVEEKVRSLMRRGYGPAYVAQVLAQKQVSINLKDLDWKEAYQVAKRKAGTREGLKLKQYLYRRGFTYGYGR
ncbi:MAG: regulatory protein RecX [Pseudomonadota bacterium]|nr:regulatory protein RecX [Pseudomonadota bacterium]